MLFFKFWALLKVLLSDYVLYFLRLPKQFQGVVLGPAGVGKTTLVNHLGGASFHTGPQAEDKTVEAQSCESWLVLVFFFFFEPPQFKDFMNQVYFVK